MLVWFPRKWVIQSLRQSYSMSSKGEPSLALSVRSQWVVASRYAELVIDACNVRCHKLTLCHLLFRSGRMKNPPDRDSCTFWSFLILFFSSATEPYHTIFTYHRLCNYAACNCLYVSWCFAGLSATLHCAPRMSFIALGIEAHSFAWCPWRWRGRMGHSPRPTWAFPF